MNQSERDDLLREMHTDIGVIKSRIEALPDHETRLRVLERFRYAFPSVAMLALGVSGVGLVIAIF